MDDRLHYIYALADPHTKQIHYVGCTVTPLTRYQNHLTNNANKVKKAWIRGLKAQGVTPDLLLLDKIVGRSEARKRETEWIQTLIAEGKPLTNDTYKGGVGHNKGRTYKVYEINRYRQ